MGQRSFDLLPGHAVGQQRQGMAQVNYVVQTAAKEIVGAGGHGNFSKTPRNSIWRDYKLKEIISHKYINSQLNQWVTDISGATTYTIF